MKVEPWPAPWRIFEEPRPKIIYLLSMDTSLGDPRLDPCAAHIWSLTSPYRQVATLYGHYSITEQARLTAWMGHVYNNAWHAVEDNNTGRAVILEGIRLGARHVTRRWLNPYGTGQTTRYGITTGPSTKPQIIEAGREEFESGNVLIRCRNTLKELRVFKFDVSPSGKEIVVPEPNKPDHRAMAYCLGMAAPRLTNLDLPRPAPKEEKKVHSLLMVPDDPPHLRRKRTRGDVWGDPSTERWGTPSF